MQSGLRLCVNLSAIVHNVEEISSYCNTDICAVIKSNAYGHGMTEVARALSRHCKMFAVARMHEARQLRLSGIRLPILVLSEFDICSIRYAAENDITLTVWDAEQIKQCINCGSRAVSNLNIHIKVNTGMNRLGIKTIAELEKMLALSRGKLGVTGIYTHFSNCNDSAGTKSQYDKFMSFVQFIKAENPLITAHCAASEAIFASGDYFLDMVRPGISIYGFCKAAKDKGVMLMPAMHVCSGVLATGSMRQGESIGYGGDYTADRDMRYAVVSAGYGDGYKRAYSGAYVVISGRSYKVIGRVCMDMIMVEADEYVCPGQLALLMCDMSDICDISVSSFAKRAGTIPYEVLTSFTERASREYIYPVHA